MRDERAAAEKLQAERKEQERLAREQQAAGDAAAAAARRATEDAALALADKTARFEAELQQAQDAASPEPRCPDVDDSASATSVDTVEEAPKTKARLRSAVDSKTPSGSPRRRMRASTVTAPAPEAMDVDGEEPAGELPPPATPRSAVMADGAPQC